MLERDLQDYLFHHPEVLFPSQAIQDKRREFTIEGRRIDLLFMVEGVRYIVELKRDTIKREHLGQIVEYYGLLRGALAAEQIRMILVAPSIPLFRRVYLEELGIRCVEVTTPLETTEVSAKLTSASRTFQKQDNVRASLATLFPNGAPLAYPELSSPATPLALAMTHRVLRDSLEGVRSAFSEYETLPVRMLQVTSPDMVVQPAPINLTQAPTFIRGGAWWAYAFGQSEAMPKNDVPNISVASMPGGLDLSVNSELQPSQKVLIRKVSQAPALFDQLIKAHGGLEFQAWLKLEHQPRFYHWIPLCKEAPGTWDAARLLGQYHRFEREFVGLRATYLAWLEQQRPELSQGQRAHLEKANRSLNVALRLARPFPAQDPFWQVPYSEQLHMLAYETARLKPMIDFFLSTGEPALVQGGRR